MMTIRASACATIPCRPVLSLVVRRVVSAISAPDTDESPLSPEAKKAYADGYQDGYRDGYEQGIDAEVCEVCNDIH